MFSMLLEKEPSEEDIPEEEEAPEEEEEAGPNEETLFLIEEISECFAVFDRNKTGSFPPQYLEKALRSLGIFLTDFEVEDLKEKLTEDGEVTFEKFYPCMFDMLSAADPHESLKIDFQAFDPDKEGILPRDRFKKWMTTLGDPLTDKEVKELIKLGDPTGTGNIAYDNLVMILAKK